MANNFPAGSLQKLMGKNLIDWKPVSATDHAAMQKPAAGGDLRRESAEHSSSGSPQRPLVLDRTQGYSQRVKGLSDQETDNEVGWHEWRMELNVTKVRAGSRWWALIRVGGGLQVLQSLCSENMLQFGEKLEKLLHGTCLLYHLSLTQDPFFFFVRVFYRF